MRQTNLNGAVLTKAVFVATTSAADLRSADLTAADLTNAQPVRTKYDDTLRPPASIPSLLGPRRPDKNGIANPQRNIEAAARNSFRHDRRKSTLRPV